MRIVFLSLLLATAVSSVAQTFHEVGGIRYLEKDGNTVVVARQDKELADAITIPATITVNNTDFSVTGIISPDDSESGGGGAFQECGITAVDLSALSITAIPDQCFQGCSLLSNVTLPASITAIGNNAFSGCMALTTLTLPAGVNELGEGAFKGSGLTAFTIPAGVTELKSEVLRDTKITSLEIPASVTKLGTHAFASNLRDTEGLAVSKTVTMGQRDCRNIEFVGDWGITAFGDMTTINLQVPAGGKVVYQEYMPWMNMNITEYGEDAGPALTPDQRHVTIDGILYMLKDGKASVAIQPETLSGEVSIPEKVTYESTDYDVTAVMGSYWSYGHLYSDYYHYNGAFTQTAVTRVTLPASIKTIGHHAFCEAQELQEVVLSEGVTTIEENAFAYCPRLTTINIPATVTTLPYGVLRECPNLTTLTLNEGITSVGNEALLNTGIETLTIPSTCTLFGYEALEIPALKTLRLNATEPANVKAIDYNGNPATMNGTVFGHDSQQEETRQRLAGVDLIVPLGTADTYKALAPWSNFRSVTDQGSSYLKLDGDFFAAPAGAFTINTAPEYEYHDGWYEDTYTHGLNLKEGTTVTFSTTGTSWVYVYLFSSNSNTVKLDGEEITNGEIGDDQSGTYSFRRYDRLVEGSGEHTITCNTYEGNQWPCMFLLRVQNVNGAYHQPQEIGVNIDGIKYVLSEKSEGDVITRTATIARQSTSLSGEVSIPAKVSYAKTVLEGNNWVTLPAYDYDVTTMAAAGFNIDEAPGIHRSTDGAFQDCQITSISLPATLTEIPDGTFNNCQKLTKVTLAEGITRIGAGAFANCTSLQDIYLPETVSDMEGWYIFGNCTSLKKVNTPKLVTSLGNGCFMDSGIETFLIPKTLTSLGEACFAAKNLKNIKICHETYTAAEGDNTATINFPEGSFDDVSGITLIVPNGKKESLYSQVYPWKDFGDIIEYTDQNDEHQYNAYRLDYEEETPAAARGDIALTHRAANSSLTGTLDYTPSGVELTLPERITKNLYTYLATWKDKPENMPASDQVVKVVLELLGDLTGDKTLDTQDAIKLIDKFLNGLNDETKRIADINGDGMVDTQDAILVINIFLNSNATE